MRGLFGTIGYVALEIVGAFLIARENKRRVRLLADDLTLN